MLPVFSKRARSVPNACAVCPDRQASGGEQRKTEVSFSSTQPDQGERQLRKFYYIVRYLGSLISLPLEEK